MQVFMAFTFFENNTSSKCSPQAGGLRILNRADFSFKEVYQQQ